MDKSNFLMQCHNITLGDPKEDALTLEGVANEEFIEENGVVRSYDCRDSAIKCVTGNEIPCQKCKRLGFRYLTPKNQ